MSNIRILFKNFLWMTVICLFPFLLLFCTPEPYLRSTLFDELRYKPADAHICTMVVMSDIIEYFICESGNKNYQIKIIPSGENRATMVIIPEMDSGGSPLESIIEKDFRQISISGEYLIEPQINLKNLSGNIRIRLYFRSLQGEKFITEALFVVDRYIVKNRHGRDKPR